MIGNSQCLPINKLLDEILEKILTRRPSGLELMVRYASKDGLRETVLGTLRDCRIDRPTVRVKLRERLSTMTARAERPSMPREGTL